MKYNPKMRGAIVATLMLAGMAFQSANAAVDAAVTTAITAAQTDLLAVLAALTTAGAAVWVGRLIYNKFRVR